MKNNDKNKGGEEKEVRMLGAGLYRIDDILICKARVGSLGVKSRKSGRVRRMETAWQIRRVGSGVTDQEIIEMGTRGELIDDTDTLKEAKIEARREV